MLDFAGRRFSKSMAKPALLSPFKALKSPIKIDMSFFACFVVYYVQEHLVEFCFADFCIICQGIALNYQHFAQFGVESCWKDTR